MKETSWKVLSAACVVLALVIAVVAIAVGGCDKMIETAAGASVPMKCHWTFRAVAMLELVCAFVSGGLLTVKCKIGRRWLSVASIAMHALCLLALYTPLMGICASAEMKCHTTALMCVPFAVIACICLVVLAINADPKKAQMPKRGL